MPVPKQQSLTLPSALTAAPKIQLLFRQWHLPDYDKRHESYQRQHLEGTCAWILNNRNFISWRDSAAESASNLLCIGSAGVGKSVLS
jgi:hypothetical protein